MPQGACDDCINNCALIHQENKITRFFKVMFGKDHDKVMPLPPDFAPKVEHLAGERFLLEDADGRKCSVLLAHFRGYLAFTEGWFSFFREHDLEETSFLTFEYMEGSKIMFVRVFAKSGGETVHNNRQGYVSRRVSNDEADPIPDIEENQNDESRPEIMVLESDKDEVEGEMVSPIEVSMGIQRESDMFDATDKSGENENRILANFEVMKIPDKVDIGSAAKATESDSDTVDKVVEIEEDCTLQTPDAETEVDKPTENVVSLEKAARGSNVRITEQNKRNESSQKDPVLGLPVPFAAKNKRKLGCEPVKKVIERKTSSGSKVKPSKAGNKAATKAKGRKVQMAANHIGGDGDRSLGESFAKAVPNKQPKDGNLSKKIPDDGRDSRNRRSRYRATERIMIEERDNFVGCSLGKQYGRKRPTPKKSDRVQTQSAIVKVEPSLSDDEHQNVSDDSFSVVVTSREYQDLPIEGALTGHVFYLKDPDGRDWPVVCRGAQCQKQFAANWDLFCCANSISEEDTCNFFRVGNSARAYRVDVVRRSLVVS